MFGKNPSPKRKGKHSNKKKLKVNYVTKEMDINKVIPKGIWNSLKR